MKKSNALIIMYFTLITLMACMVSCSTTQHGYDYKAHRKRGNDPALRKCYDKHNKW